MKDSSHIDRERVARGLVDAGMALASPLPLDRLLQVLVDVARELVSARFAALGVINEERSGLSDFVTSGMTAEQRARIGNLPEGRGILGLLVRDARVIRLKDLRDHPASVGMPQHHPVMKSFLGVPVMAKDRVFGNLYLTEKIGADEFSSEDEALVQVLAAQAAIAVENARLRQARDRFFAAASHELGNAITGVKVWARHLVQHPPTDQAVWMDGTRKILSGAEQTDRLIEDLLSLSRIEEGRLTFTPWPVDVAELVRSSIEHLRPEAQAVGVRIAPVVGDGAPAVEQDPTRLRQILINLLANAVKFSPEGGEVTVRVDSQGEDHIDVRVTDTGPGIRAEDAERIFLPYEQVQGVAKGRGSGLGLPLSRQLARLMGGELWVDDGAGRGATFKLRLPARMPAPDR